MCRILEALVLTKLVALKLHCIAFVQNLFPIKLKTENGYFTLQMLYFQYKDIVSLTIILTSMCAEEITL